MTCGQLLRLSVELVIDAVRGKLGGVNPPASSTRPRSAPPPLTWSDVEIQARASRNAGHEKL